MMEEDSAYGAQGPADVEWRRRGSQPGDQLDRADGERFPARTSLPDRGAFRISRVRAARRRALYQRDIRPGRARTDVAPCLAVRRARGGPTRAGGLCRL